MLSAISDQACVNTAGATRNARTNRRLRPCGHALRALHGLNPVSGVDRPFGAHSGASRCARRAGFRGREMRDTCTSTEALHHLPCAQRTRLREPPDGGGHFQRPGSARAGPQGRSHGRSRRFVPRVTPTYAISAMSLSMRGRPVRRLRAGGTRCRRAVGAHGSGGAGGRVGEGHKPPAPPGQATQGQHAGVAIRGPGRPNRSCRAGCDGSPPRASPARGPAPRSTAR